MASSEDNETEAAKQLGTMSLSASEERKDAEPTTTNGTPTKMCSACGKESDTLKKCTACKCVWYCDKECQNKHRKEHRKECKLIKKELDKRGGKLELGTEKKIGLLGKLPPREECPICMQVLPIHAKLKMYKVCCGKMLCSGCELKHQMKSEEHPTCAFCRTAVPDSEEGILPRFRKRADLEDPQALFNLAMAHGYGKYGLPVDQAKCIELLRKSAALGSPGAHYQLGDLHRLGRMGLEQNDEKSFKYFTKATEGGDVLARHNLGNAEYKNDDMIAAMCHWRLSASAGYRDSMKSLICCFEFGLVHHGDLADALRAMYRARSDLCSEDRTKFLLEYMKLTGEYKEEYEA